MLMCGCFATENQVHKMKYKTYSCGPYICQAATGVPYQAAFGMILQLTLLRGLRKVRQDIKHKDEYMPEHIRHSTRFNKVALLS